MNTAHDPGGKVRIKIRDGVMGGATISPCGRYRRELVRWKEKASARGGYVLWVGMNPSTADASVDDPTCRREWNYTCAWGYGQYIKMNIGDYRATNPRDLPADGSAVAPGNLEAIIANAISAERIIIAHGNPPKPLAKAARDLFNMLLESRASDRVYCLGLTAQQWPRHPLYARKDLVPERYLGIALPWT